MIRNKCDIFLVDQGINRKNTENYRSFFLKSPHLTLVFQYVSEKNTLSVVIKLEETTEEMKSWNTHLSSI